MEYKRECIFDQFGQVMHSKFQTFLKYFKYEAKSLSRSNKLNFNKSFDRIFLYFITLFPAPIRNRLLRAKQPMHFVRRGCLLKPVRSPR